MARKLGKRPPGRPSPNDTSVISDQDLLETLLQSFGENGFDGTSVREIARNLGVSHNLIPQRFGSKKRLWYAAVDHGFKQIYRALELESKTLGDDDLLILRGLMTRAIELTSIHPSVLRIINQEACTQGPRLDYLHEKYIKPACDFVDEWLKKLAAEGRMKPCSVTQVYFLVSHGGAGQFAMTALAEKLREAEPNLTRPDIKTEANGLVAIVFDGLLVT